MMTRLQLGTVSLAALLLAACAAAPAMVAAPGTEPPPVGVVVADLERAQELAAAGFDAVVAGDERCEQLCTHLDAICTIAGRICDLASQHPSPDHDATCLRTQGRCDHATGRMPTECSACTE